MSSTVRVRLARPTSGSRPGATRATCSSRARSCASCPRTRWSRRSIAEAEKLVAEGVEARLAAADAGAEREAEEDRKALFESKGADVNNSGERIEMIRKKIALEQEPRSQSDRSVPRNSCGQDAST